MYRLSEPSTHLYRHTHIHYLTLSTNCSLLFVSIHTWHIPYLRSFLCLFPSLLPFLSPTSSGSHPWVMTTLVPALPHVCTVLCSWLWQRAIAMFSLAIFPVGCLLSFHSICLFHLLRLSWPRILHLISSLSAWWHPVNAFDWYLKLEKDDSVADIWVCVVNRCSWQCYYVPGMITWQSHSK